MLDFGASMKQVKRETTPKGEGLSVKNKKQVSILELLHWAFQKEHAGLIFNSYLDDAHHVSGYDTIYMMMRQEQLGVRVDSSGGRSKRHEDAELVADALMALPDRGTAIMVAELARSGRCPDWMEGVKPQVQPCEWGKNRHGWYAKTKVVGASEVLKRGRLIRTDILCCPITISPTHAQIASARRSYLKWWGALLDLSSTFQLYGGLSCHEVTSLMPQRAPWKN